ncbi:hydrogenase maturation protein HypF [Thermoanaerobacter uzonensis DSM 18761]|jgi:hydrogenase maturation protein HypF|uniref:Carbamoyltransferase n=1 Tax=Thermoanaerobacter uzonensis DSM 18761 TaxID=1123369 RepID=A0A1M4S9B1_9THEO|nr:carbamoyltransferase HypF [Thermoanaerobacter uzonensis]SHE28745.1 hydrogenase maturation protein HypF [Thermoanaerobacter uzonensis DSM 18761]
MVRRRVSQIQARQINIYGIVQGVGFRPFVFNIAQKYNLKGMVYNNSSGVYIEVEGEKENVECFIKEIKENPPSLAVIDEIKIKESEVKNYREFKIRESKEDDGFVPVSPDMGVCDDCLKEMNDPNDRRYRYPFINCTNCGPRFSIIEDIPYDRPKTSMKVFPMCEKCEQEYNNPNDRRFHAQPIACFDCGPKLEFVGDNCQEDEIKCVVDSLKRGKIVAIKGIGGFHLAVNALDDEAVSTLRSRKKRYGKPFAVMMKDIKQVEEYCIVSEEEKKLLLSQRKPIVLLKKKGEKLARGVADGLNTLGVMLPYAPIHYLLMEEIDFPIVMTSGNVSEEPLCKDNEEALEKLKDIADAFLLNNRDIVNRIDDSVTSFNGGAERIIRRARGYAPQPILLKKDVKANVLAVGGFYKNTFCMTRGQYAFISHHIGDLDNGKTFEYYKEQIERYKGLFRVTPQVIAHDMHKGYLSTQYALSCDLPRVEVQHHHAHIASCMAEYNITDKVIGIAYDGTGYGTDGNIWGAEFLICDLKDFLRVGHLKYKPLPGGELAIRKIYRVALGFISEDINFYKDFVERFDSKEVDLILKQIEKKINTPYVSSMGRFFDAAASLLGVKDQVLFEGQGAMELESLIIENDDFYDFDVYRDEEYIINPEIILHQLYEDYKNGIDKRIIATKFHNSIVEFTHYLALELRKEFGINKVVLSGGSFQNRYLLKKLLAKLTASGFEVYSNSKVPCNDGGISLGQAVIANRKLEG